MHLAVAQAMEKGNGKSKERRQLKLMQTTRPNTTEVRVKVELS